MIKTHWNMYIYYDIIYIYIYVYVCVCVCCAFVGLGNKLYKMYIHKKNKAKFELAHCNKKSFTNFPITFAGGRNIFPSLCHIQPVLFEVSNIHLLNSCGLLYVLSKHFPWSGVTICHTFWKTRHVPSPMTSRFHNRFHFCPPSVPSQGQAEAINTNISTVISRRILCLWFRASLIYINNCPTRCNTKQSIYFSASSLYVFRVSITPTNQEYTKL